MALDHKPIRAGEGGHDRQDPREALEAAGISADTIKPHKLRIVATSQALAPGGTCDEVQTAALLLI